MQRLIIAAWDPPSAGRQGFSGRCRARDSPMTCRTRPIAAPSVAVQGLHQPEPPTVSRYVLTFRKVVPPRCTPLTEDGKVGTASLERLTAFRLDAGVHGLFVGVPPGRSPN
ncbi:hypothetical protein GCM10022206_38320 [Streptomyces chiangmaiensis]